jgi:hypothetical protein
MLEKGGFLTNAVFGAPVALLRVASGKCRPHSPGTTPARRAFDWNHAQHTIRLLRTGAQYNGHSYHTLHLTVTGIFGKRTPESTNDNICARAKWMKVAHSHYRPGDAVIERFRARYTVDIEECGGSYGPICCFSFRLRSA